jgi:hypothetical protein
MRSIDPCPNCGGTKPHKGRKLDCGFVEPEPPLGGEAYTVLLHDDFFTPTYNRLAPWTAQGDPINFLYILLI